MRRLVLAAALAAPVLLATGQPAAAEPTWPDVAGIVRDAVQDTFGGECFQNFVTRPAEAYRFAEVDGLTVTIYGENIVGAAGNEAGYVVRYVDCTVS